MLSCFTLRKKQPHRTFRGGYLSSAGDNGFCYSAQKYIQRFSESAQKCSDSLNRGIKSVLDVLHVVGSVAAFDQAEDVELDRQIDVERLDIGVGGGYRAADLGLIYGVLWLHDAALVARLDFDDHEQVG